MSRPYSEAQKRATRKYLSEKTDELKVRVPKGQREQIKAKAAALGFESVNQFILAAIEAFEDPAPAGPDPFAE